jgi:hypothetical protein
LKRHLRRCKECETPLAYSKFIRWFPNGTVIGIDGNRTRLVFLETELLTRIIDGISAAIGFNIQPIVIEAERRIGRSFIDTLIPSIYHNLGLYHLPRSQALINPPSQYIFDHVAGLGYGRFILLNYKFRKSMTVLCRNPYNSGMLMGDSLGVWEFLENKEGVCQGGTESGMLKITLEESREPQPHQEDRLVPAKPVYTPGKSIYDICPGCRLPSFIGKAYAWNLDEGVCNDRRTGQRVACMPVASLEAVIRELEEELGQDIPRLVLDISTRAVREFCGSIRLESWHDFERQLREMPLRGMGSARITARDQDSCLVTVDNPFSPILIDGILTGCLANIWHKPVYSRFDRNHGSFSYAYRFSC